MAGLKEDAVVVVEVPFFVVDEAMGVLASGVGGLEWCVEAGLAVLAAMNEPPLDDDGGRSGAVSATKLFPFEADLSLASREGAAVVVAVVDAMRLPPLRMNWRSSRAES